MGRGVLLQHLSNGEEDNSPGTVTIPTIDGGAPLTHHEGARVHLHDIEALQESRHEQLLRHHIQAIYKDDLFLNCKLGPRASPLQRPKSLAVPGITTSSFLQELQGPVMSISPQATYMSTIIPNAVLPAEIDVIEINRSRSRRSVRTVSKNSLSSASPGSSRSGGGARDAPPSNGSKWSHSQSSETIISNSSTISLRGNAQPAHVTFGVKEVTHLNHEEQMSVKSSSSWVSSSTKEAGHKPEQEDLSDAAEDVRNSRLFSRSLSIMKAKLPPAPPRRTYSLHQDMLKQKSWEQVNTKDQNNLEFNCGRMNGDINAKEEHTSSSNGLTSSNSPVTAYLDDSHSSLTLSPHSPDQDITDALASGNSSPQNKFARTMSPSSGYSSQSGTPTHSSKDICPTSPGKNKVKPPKPERLGARISPVVSVSSSMNSLSSVSTDTAHLSTETHTTESQPPKVSPAVTTVNNKITPAPTGSTLRELFNIPPPPKVKAPCAPPPETWVHSKRTVELLCGPCPCPNRLYGLQKQQQKDSIIMRTQDTTDHTEKERQISVEINKTEPCSEDKEVTTGMKEKFILQVTLDKNIALGHPESPPIHEKGEESHPEKETASCKIEKQEQKKTEDLKMEQESPLEKVPDHVDNACALLENDSYCTDNEISDHKPTEILEADTSRVTVNSPPPSPPPAHHPPPPPSKKAAPSSVSMPSTEEETEKQDTSLECSWPPPPPPMEETPDFEGQDEIDFPPPPPPSMHESLSNILEHSSVEQGDSISPKDSYIADTANQAEVNPELQTNKEQSPADATLNVPEVSDNKSFDKSSVNSQSCEVSPDTSKYPDVSETSSQSQDVCFQLMPEKITQEDPPNLLTVSAQDLSNSETSTLTAVVVPKEDQATVNFRRQPSLISKDNKSKEIMSRQKSAPISKEDANIPLVTPSLLQMVRLRSVNAEDQVNILSQEGKSDLEATPGQDQGTSSQVIPQKPIRKSCLKSAQPSVRSSSATVLGPSMRLQEAIRMKTAAMSSREVPARLSLRLPSNDIPAQCHKTSESCDMHKSPASTASFIFSKSTKKVVIETPTSPEVQAVLKQNLAAELMQISDQAKSMVTNEKKRPAKVPPPVAKKPVHATNSLDKPGAATQLTNESSSSKQTVGAENGQTETVQPAGQQAQSPGTIMPASKI